MPIPETVKALPPEDKLALVTAIWDDLATSAPISLPSDELFEMRRRRTELEHDPTSPKRSAGISVPHQPAASARGTWCLGAFAPLRPGSVSRR